MARYNSNYYYSNDYEDQYPWKGAVSSIYALRRDGELEEALELSRSAHEEYPDEDDVTKAYGWTLCSICKQAIQLGMLDEARDYYENEYKNLTFNYADEFVTTLRKSFSYIAKQLDPSCDKIEAAIKESKEGNPKSAAEKMLLLLQQHAIKKMHVEDLGWVLYRYINSYDGNQEDSPLASRCLKAYSTICDHKKSMLHSSMLVAVLKISLRRDFKFDKYFFDVWGPENLRDDDYQDNTYEGKTYPSLFFRVCNYYVERGINFDIDSFCERTGKKPVSVADSLRRCWFWKLYRESQKGKGETLWSMFNEYTTAFSAYGASAWHSQVMKLAVRCMVEQDSHRLLPFFVAWGHNFCNSDWEPSTGKDGKEYGPLAGRVIKAAFDVLNESNVRDSAHITFLISALSEAVEKSPTDEWNKRNLGRLYSMNGDRTSAEAIYQDLSKVLFDKYYYWQEFSQIVSDSYVKAGMLAKALLIESNENYIGDIRLEMASYLISAGNKNAAAIELERYHSNRTTNGWRIPEKYNSLKRSINDIPAGKGNNLNLYQSLAVSADEFVYKDLPWEDMVIAESWKTEDNKSFILLTDGKGHNIRAKRHAHKSLRDAHLGQAFQVKYESETNKLLLLKPSTCEDWAVIPEVCAFVEYVNTEKNVAHTITSDNKSVFFHYDPAKQIKKGSFVKVRYYEKENKDKETRINVVSWNLCKKEVALPSFRNKIVVVDDVNPSKSLFHFILGRGLIGGIVRYSDTHLRPEIGDFLKVHYCITRDKAGKKIAQVISVESTDDVAEGMVFTTTGFVDIKYDRFGHQFGFINNYYVPEELTYDPVCEGRVEAKVLNIQAGKERVFSLKAAE